jgi:AcrR family transcriptional regulator
VGVVPNAAYRHFADREALLAAIRDEALSMLAQRMAEGASKISAGPHTPLGAALRLRVVGESYLAFAREEPGLFDTAFTTAHPHRSADDPDAGPIPFDHLRAALNNLVEAGLLPPERQPVIEYPIWATVHGTATLLRGPLKHLPDREKQKLEAQALDLIASALQQPPNAAGPRA